MLTGDKRCIRAVASLPGGHELKTKLVGRVLCLEQVVLRAMDLLGFGTLKGRIVGSSYLELDTAVRAAFGSGLHATERNARGSLERRVRQLAAESEGLLVEQEYRFADDDGID